MFGHGLRCIYNFAPFTESYIKATYGLASKNPHQLPDKRRKSRSLRQE